MKRDPMNRAQRNATALGTLIAVASAIVLIVLGGFETEPLLNGSALTQESCHE